MSKLLVLTDLGTFKAFQWREDRASSTPRLEIVDSYETVLGDDRISRRLSDQAGRFGKLARVASGINDGENGERHNIWLESERRSVKQIAQRISELLGGEDVEGCYLAAGKEINHAILENLNAQARAKIEKNVHCNLVNARREEILRHFA